MDTSSPKAPEPKQDLPLSGRLMMWLFLATFLVFGAIMIGDLLRGLWR